MGHEVAQRQVSTDFLRCKIHISLFKSCLIVQPISNNQMLSMQKIKLPDKASANNILEVYNKKIT